MSNILFICQANIGRSQMAEAFFNHMTNSRQATSAACEDFIQKYNGKPTREIINSMKEVGINMERQRMKLLTPAMVKWADQIIVLCDQKFCPDFVLKNSDKVLIKTVEDPHDKDSQSIAKIRDQIQQIVINIIEI
ncbi:MAG: low molecular weight phosphatase family protein [Candidatus Pacebacteria bacterium]|nr:low molecular weight phosphatase family protein [Candidatus Paceibacterota bacterium]